MDLWFLNLILLWLLYISTQLTNSRNLFNLLQYHLLSNSVKIVTHIAVIICRNSFINLFELIFANVFVFDKISKREFLSYKIIHQTKVFWY